MKKLQPIINKNNRQMLPPPQNGKYYLKDETVDKLLANGVNGAE